jgi:small subunit ribosomal protein S20
VANIKSAEKKNRQRLKRRERNQHHLSTMRTYVKRVRTLLEQKTGKGVTAATKTEIADALKVAVTQIDKAAGKGVLARKAASRKISRLTVAAHGRV